VKGRLIVFSAVFATAILAHEEPKGKAVTITGMVVDTGCYFSHGAIGDKHTECATTCAKAGVPLAIVDGAGKVYLPIAADHKNPNAKLMPFIEKKVKVTGTAMVKGGLEGIVIKSVEAAP
jgi:hypothetical protein